MIVGLTGGLACGKTLVAGEFKRLGAVVIDTDEIAREVARPDGAAYAGIVEAFGKEILKDKSSEIDRKALGRVVFGDTEKLKKLNSLIHPHIRKTMRERVSAALAKDAKSVIVVVVPLLYEVGLEAEMDRVIAVYAPEEEQIRRVVERDGLSRAEVLQRIRAQMPAEEKKRRADCVIENAGSMDEAIATAGRVYEKLASEATKTK